MKRYDNLYQKIYDIENLKLAHKHARKGKGWYEEVKMIDENPDYYLGLLQEMLKNMKYFIRLRVTRPGRFINFRISLIEFVNGRFCKLSNHV